MFLSEHDGEIQLHKTAKQAFDKLGLTKLPTAKALRADYAEQLALKKEAYAEYKTARSDMRALLNAKRNVDVLSVWTWANPTTRLSAGTVGSTANLFRHGEKDSISIQN